MGTQTFYAKQSAQISNTDRSFNDHSSSTFSYIRFACLMDFNIVPAQHPFNVITSVALGLYFQESPTSASPSINYSPLTSDFDEVTVNYNTKPGTYAVYTYKFNTTVPSGQYSEIPNINADGLAAGHIVRNGIQVSIPSAGGIIQSSHGINKPYIGVTTSEQVATGVLKDFAPAAGYIDLSKDNIFSFGFEQKISEPSIVPLTIKSFTVQLREHGQTEAVSVNVSTWSGEAPNVTIPAGTISGTSIDWRVIAKTNANQTLTSEWMTLSVEDVPPTAWPISPKDMVVDGSKDQVFLWGHSSSTGTAQSKTDLQISTDGATWAPLTTVTGSARQWTCPAGTLTSSMKYWRVRTYNADGEAGEWSDPAKISVVAAPTTPIVQIKSASPRPSIGWQTNEQEACQVELDGMLSGGTQFGTDKTWTSPQYLADGNHTIRVRVQNLYGIWSEWGTVTVLVVNTPGGAITLTAEAGREVTLAWEASSFDYYIVYRDGVAIARTTELLYTDRTSIGQVKYQVRGCYASSANYSLSDAVTVTVSTPSTCLYDLDAEQWVYLRYDASAHRSTAYSLARDIQYLQLSGRAYPVAERSEFLQRSLHVACVCFTAVDRARMLSVLGHLVCVKTPEGNMVTGYIANLSETSDDFFSTYGFDVAQADVKEEIDIDEA